MAADLGIGLPIEHRIRTCLLALELGGRAGMSEADRSDLYYLTLLRMLGCTAGSRESAEHFTDEIAFGRDTQHLDYGDPEGVVRSGPGAGAARADGRHAVRVHAGAAPRIPRRALRGCADARHSPWTAGIGHRRSRVRVRAMGWPGCAECDSGRPAAPRRACHEPVQRARGTPPARWRGR